MGAFPMDNLLLYAAVAYADDPTRESAGNLTGVLVTYGERASDRADVYQLNSLSWEPNGIVLNEMHDRQQAIKRFTPYLDGAELRVDFPLPPTQKGRDAAYMVRDGTYTGLSMEVARDSIVATYQKGVRYVSKGRLIAAALVDKAAFSGSVVDVHSSREKNQIGVMRWL